MPPFAYQLAAEIPKESGYAAPDEPTQPPSSHTATRDQASYACDVIDVDAATGEVVGVTDGGGGEVVVVVEDVVVVDEGVNGTGGSVVVETTGEATALGTGRVEEKRDCRNSGTGLHEQRTMDVVALGAGRWLWARMAIAEQPIPTAKRNLVGTGALTHARFPPMLSCLRKRRASPELRRGRGWAGLASRVVLLSVVIRGRAVARPRVRDAVGGREVDGDGRFALPPLGHAREPVGSDGMAAAGTDNVDAVHTVLLATRSASVNGVAAPVERSVEVCALYVDMALRVPMSEAA